MKNNSRFLDLFSTLGTNCNLTNDQLQRLEHFICTTFGKKRLHSVNEAMQGDKSFGRNFRKRIR